MEPPTLNTNRFRSFAHRQRPNHEFKTRSGTYRKSARASSPSGTCKLQRTCSRRSFTPSPSYFSPPAVLRSTLSATCKKYEFVPLRRLVRRGSHTNDTYLNTQLLPKPRQQLELFGLYHSGISRHFSMQQACTSPHFAYAAQPSPSP
jgi:hypothetical protein